MPSADTPAAAYPKRNRVLKGTVPKQLVLAECHSVRLLYIPITAKLAINIAVVSCNKRDPYTAYDIDG